MKRFFFAAFLMLPVFLMAQKTDTLTLEECQQMARANYPLIRQSGLLSEAAALRIRNLNKNWLPQVNVNLQASYQSDVTEVSIPVAFITMPEISKDMYRATLDVSQVIYDGGITAGQKTLENTALQADRQSVEVEMNKIRERINQIYFSLILAAENEQLLITAQDEIISRLSKVNAAVRNETAIQNTENVLKAELIKSDQQLIEVRAAKQSAIEMLNEFTGGKAGSKTVFVLPDQELAPGGYTNRRPEMELFSLQMNNLEAAKRLSDAKLMPRITAFGQLGCGRPGLNMLDPDFDGWYMIGARVSWNPWDWNLSKNEKKILDIRKDMLMNQKDAFDRNVKVAVAKETTEIEKYAQLMKKDEEIIALRREILRTASVQLDNDVITATEYTTELHALIMAQMNYQLHRIQRQLTVSNYLFNIGK